MRSCLRLQNIWPDGLGFLYNKNIVTRRVGFLNPQVKRAARIFAGREGERCFSRGKSRAIILLWSDRPYYFMKENDTMPNIDIKLFPGRCDEMKKAAAAKIVEAAAAELQAPVSAFSVSFTDVEKDAWNETVADKIDEATLFAGEVYRA